MEALIETPRCTKNLQKIREQLNKGKVITVQSVRASIGTQELRTYISILRREFKIDSVWVTASDGRRFKRYWKSKDVN